MLELSGLGRDFITMFVTIDPIGSIPVFLFAASSVPEKMRRGLAVRGVVIAGAVLLAFLVGGQFLLELLGLRLGAFQVAGGIILFIFAMTMIFGESKPEAEIAEAEREESHAAARAGAMARAVFPLAMPSIASPGAMLAVVILTDNHRVSLVEQVVTAGLLVAVLLITLVLLLLAAGIQRIIGASGVSVISRVMGMIIATIAVDAVLTGLDVLGVLSMNDAPSPM
ncbi:MAG: MarC family transcriptional regulator [Rhodobacteraceae bacterium]|nr:MarC family transcriptional regulator [Paracoccaceae bacterium]MAY44246.1 MarC family transcriptional regulator [Paracoccaceae bacterium]QEW22139.1 inner membrane protein [Marinibacterium anthonyi]